MRKWLGIITIAIYGILSTGLTIHLHYCHGKLKHFAIATEADSCCKTDHSCATEDEMHSSCCDDENYALELGEDHTGAQQFSFEFQKAIIETSVNVAFSKHIRIEKPVSENLFSRPPPDRPRFILHSSLILYA